MRNPQLISVALAGLVPLVLLSSGCQQTRIHNGISNQTRKAPETPSSTTAQGGSIAIQAQMRQLLLERNDLLERQVGIEKKSLEYGRGTVSEYAQARIAALLAGIDLCNNKSERHEIHGEIVELYKEIEKQTEREIERGQRPTAGLVKTRVARLEAEIDLLKEQLSE